MLVGKSQAALLMAPGSGHRDTANAAKTYLESELTNVQFARFEPSISEEIRLDASA